MEYKKIGDLCIVKGGKRLPKGTQLVESKTEHPYLRITDYSSGKIDLKKIKYITDATFESISKYVINEGDIFLSIVGTIGIVDIVSRELDGASLTENAVKIINDKPDILDTRYLAYFLESSYGQHEINIRTVGSTQKKLAITRIKDIPVPMMSLNKQEQLCDILQVLDSKIELNNQMIDTLEEIASTLFKRWFVDFEFPDENGNPYKSSGGKMIDSELGEIPEGWEISSIDEISKNIVTGKTPSTKKVEFYGGNIPFITIPDMHNKTFIVESERYLTEEGKIENKILPRNSICVSCIATPGLVVFNSIESQTNQQINSIIPHDIDRYWLFLNIKGKRQLIRELGSGGSTTLNLNKTQFGKIQLISPKFEVKEKFNVIVKPLFDLILGKLRENVTLVDSRDSLLPKLLSGELEV